MAEKEEKKVLTVKGLGDVVETSRGNFTMSDKELQKFYEAHGIPNPKEVFNQISTAQEELIVASAEFLKKHTIDTLGNTTLAAGTGNGKVTVTLAGKTENRNPMAKPGDANEIITKYGVVSAKVQMKVPNRLKEEGGVLSQISADVEAAFKKKGL